MTLSARMSLGAIALVLPILALAADPPVGAASVPNVEGLRAQLENGKVTVYWNPVEGAIKNYRVFYSHASILDQGGVYDDYEDAPGNAIQHTLSSVPPVQMLYVSVLAVAADGSESPFFMEEVTVDLTSSVAEEAKEEEKAVAPVESSVLRLLTAHSSSSTGVILTFTHPLSIPEQYALEAFALKSGSGVPLKIVRYRLDGKNVILDTELQTSGRVYQVTIHGSVAGKTETNGLAPQEGTTAVLFTGLGSDLSLPEVATLKLTAKKTATANDIVASWTVPEGTFRALQVRQSVDGGKTPGIPMRLERTAKGVTIPNVNAASFTLLVQVVGTDGTVSKGVQQTIVLGTAASASSKLATVSSRPTTVTPKPISQPGALPQSGPALVTVLGLSGAVAGMRFMRRQNAKKR